MAQRHVIISDKPPKNPKMVAAGKRNKNAAEALKPYHFKKGQSGNPSGRPKGSTGHGTKLISEAYHAYLQKQIPEEDCLKLGIDPADNLTWADMIAVRTMQRSIGIVGSDKVCFDAIQELREVTEGKIPEKAEVTGKDGAALSAPPQVNIVFKDPPPSES